MGFRGPDALLNLHGRRLFGSYTSRQSWICTQEIRLLSRLDGILIEMVVEEREPGKAVVVVAIDLDRGTILAHSRLLRIWFKLKSLREITATNNQLLSATKSNSTLINY
jgi:hypothetical protein